VHAMRSLTGFPVIILGVCIQTTKQMQLSWSLESGYLKSIPLVKVCQLTLPLQCIFCTYWFYRSIKPYSPHHLQHQVCLSSHSLLICDLQHHFNLQTAGSWSPIYGGFHYQGLYNYVVDVFEDTPGPVLRKCAQDLLNW
jgi:hypothetical protein